MSEPPRKEPLRVFSTHPREHLAALDHAIGTDVRAILSEPAVSVRERVRAAMVVIVTHVASTQTLARAAAADNRPEWAR